MNVVPILYNSLISVQFKVLANHYLCLLVSYGCFEIYKYYYDKQKCCVIYNKKKEPQGSQMSYVKMVDVVRKL